MNQSTKQATEDNLLLFVAAGTLLIALLVIFILIFIYRYHKNQQRFYHERLRFKESVLQTKIEIREETLRLVSRELHDNIGHIASLIKIHLHLMSPDLPEEDRERVTETRELLKQLISGIKSLSVSLNSENITRLGLTEVLRNTADRINGTGQLRVTLHISGSIPSLPEGAELILYRMYQELLSNTMQHAEASEVRMTITCPDQYVDLTYTDNGKGFDTALVRTQKQQGSGLLNLHERCEWIGGSFDIESKPGLGVKVRVRVPAIHQDSGIYGDHT